MNVRHLMSAPAVELAEGETVQRAAELMLGHDVGALIVIDKDRSIRGVVTDRDLVSRCLARGYDATSLPVGECLAVDYAGRPAATVHPDADLEQAVDLMHKFGVRRLAVTEDGVHALGMLSLDEIAVDLKKYVDAFLSVAARHHKARA